MITLSENGIQTGDLISAVSDRATGATAVFIGTARDHTQGKGVLALEFEAYQPMALKELEKIAEESRRRWGVHKVAIVHAVGRVEIGDPAVAIAVSAPHRDEAFSACRFIIDTLKETVPIWKKEIFIDGEVWVNAHP